MPITEILKLVGEFIGQHWRIFGVIFIIAGASIYEHHTGYMEGLEVLAQYKVAQNKLIQDAQQLKIAKETQDAKHTQEIMDSYDASVSTLAQRLRDIQAMPRGTGVPVASEGRFKLTMPVPPRPASGVDDSSKIEYGTVCTNDFYSRALEDANQLKYLQEWVRSVQ